MLKGKNRARVSVTDMQGLVNQVNKIFSQIQQEIAVVNNKIDLLTRGTAKDIDVEVGTIRLVEEKKGSDKYKLEAKFKDGIKVADVVFEDRRRS